MPLCVRECVYTVISNAPVLYYKQTSPFVMWNADTLSIRGNDPCSYHIDMLKSNTNECWKVKGKLQYKVTISYVLEWSLYAGCLDGMSFGEVVRSISLNITICIKYWLVSLFDNFYSGMSKNICSSCFPYSSLFVFPFFLPLPPPPQTHANLREESKCLITF